MLVAPQLTAAAGPLIFGDLGAGATGVDVGRRDVKDKPLPG